MTASTTNVWPCRASFAATTMASTIPAVQVLGYASSCDGGAGHYLRLSSAPNPVLAGHVQTVDGAWWALDSHTEIPVEALGVSTSSPDNTAAIASAIAWIAAKGGGKLVFGPGVYQFAGTISVTSNNITLAGAGSYVTTLQFTGATATDCVTATGPGSGSFIEGFLIRDLTIDATARTGGRSLYIAWIIHSLVRDLILWRPWNGMEFYCINEAYIDSVTVDNVMGQWGIYFHAPCDGSARADALTLNNTAVQCGYSGADGMWWEGYANTLNANNLTFLGTHKGLWVKSHQTSYYPQFGEFNNVICDGVLAVAVQFDAGFSMQFVNSILSNTSIAPSTGGAGTQGGADTNALVINADIPGGYASNFQFTNCTIGSCARGAAVIYARNVLFENCAFADGGKAASNTYDAVTIASPAQEVEIRNCAIQYWGSHTNYRYGYNVGAGTSQVKICGCDVYTANTRGILWQTTDAGSWCESVGSASGGARLARSGWANPSALVPTNGMTLTASSMLGGMLQLEGSPGNCTIHTPTAAQLVAAMQEPFSGATVDLLLLQTSANTHTLVAGSGVSLAGNLDVNGHFPLGPLTSRFCKLVFSNTTPGAESVQIYG